MKKLFTLLALCIIGCLPSFAAAANVYLTGTMNGWTGSDNSTPSSSWKFTPINGDNNHQEFYCNLDAETYEFKILTVDGNNFSWNGGSSFSFGNQLTLNYNNGNNLKMSLSKSAKLRFEYWNEYSGSPKLTVTQIVYPDQLYLVGNEINDMENQWSTTSYVLTKQSDGYTYSWSGNSLGSHFKITDNINWSGSFNLGAPNNTTFITLEQAFTLLNDGNSSNLSFNEFTKIIHPIVTVNLDNMTLTVTGKGVTIPTNMFIVGEANGNDWDPTKTVKMNVNKEEFSAENVFIRGEDPNFGYVNFSTATSSNSFDWSGLGTRYGATSKDLLVDSCDPFELVIASPPYSFKLGDGYYDIVIKFDSDGNPTVSFTQKNMTLSVGSDNTEQSGSVNDAAQTIEMVSLNKEVHVFISTYNGSIPYYKVEETGPADSIIIPDDGEQGEEPGMGASKIRAASTIVSDYQEAQIFDYDGDDKGKYFAVLPVGKKGTLSIIFDKDGENIYPTVYNFNVAKDTPTAVEEIEETEAGEAVYYNLQGTRVYNPERGIFIKVTNGKTQKVIL